jgi:hypothetical protein
VYGELTPIQTAQGQEVPAIPVVIQNPHKVAALRLPTSEEVAAYTSSMRQLVRRIGRRSEDQTINNAEAERKFFDFMRLDKSGDEFDEAEVRHAIDLVLRHTVIDCQRDGDLYVITVATLWGNTVHTCRIPTTRELASYREGVIKSRDLPHNVEERRFPPDVPAKFYDSIITAVDGYAPQFNVPVGTTNGNRHALEAEELKQFLPQIPPHHKRSVAREVSSALYDLDPQLDPNG